MPGKIDNRAVEQVARELADAGSAFKNAEASLEDARARRNAAVMAATELGFTRRLVADLTGLTVGRVQQILEAAGKAGRPTGGLADQLRMNQQKFAKVADYRESQLIAKGALTRALRASKKAQE